MSENRNTPLSSSSFHNPRPRRNPRPINCCTECRLRKSKCSRSYPCQNCNLFHRNCVFIGSPQSKPKGKKKAERVGIRDDEDAAKTPPRDYDWASYQQNVSPDYDQWDYLVADPQATHDGTYLDDYDDSDEKSDTIGPTLQIGRMILTERIGGLFRPHYAKELGALLAAKGRTERIQPAVIISPFSAGHKIPSPSPSFALLPTNTTLDCPDLILPHRFHAEVLYQQYLRAVNPIAHILHIPSFKRMFDSFWDNVDRGSRNSGSRTAMILAVCMSAAASMSSLQAKNQLGVDQTTLYCKLQADTEVALRRANCMSSSSIQTMQAFTIYLITQCRAEVSRAHSVLVGALIRLAQCVGIHRDTKSLGLLQRHVRSILWYHICYLDVKTAEAQGPQPTIRSDDFDVPMPSNVDDIAFEMTPFDSLPVIGWTDTTFALIRFECSELHRMIFKGRILVDRGNMSLNELRVMVDTKKRFIKEKYLSFLDIKVPIQRCAQIIAKLLMARCDSMILYRYLPKGERTESEKRLRDILVEAAFVTLESGATLETAADLAPFAWFAGAYQQYHTVLLLLIERYKDPEFPSSGRVGTIIDHVFGHCYGISLTQRCEEILWMVKEGLESFYDLRRVTSSHKESDRQGNGLEDNNNLDLEDMDVQMKLSEAELEELVRSFQQDQYGTQDHSMLGGAHDYWQGW